MGSPGLTLGHMQQIVLISGIIQNPTTTIDTKTPMKILKSHQAISILVCFFDIMRRLVYF